MMRQVCPVEKACLTVPENVQLAMKFTTSTVIPEVIERVCNAGIGLRLKIDDQFNVMTHNTPFNILKIPNHIVDVQEAADWIDQNGSPELTKTLATVAANDRIVAYNCQHMCADGRLMLHFVNHLFDNDVLRHKVCGLPKQQPVLFKEMFDKYNETAPYTPVNQLTRLQWRRQRPSVFDKSRKAQYKLFKLPSTKLTCYDPASKRLVGLTDSLLMSMLLSAQAYNKKLESSMCMMTVVDMRTKMQARDVGFDVCNNYVCVPTIARGVTKETTLEELRRRLRSDLRYKIENNGVYPCMRFEDFAQDGTTIMSLSNMGVINIKPPFEDVWVQQTMEEHETDYEMCLLSWSKVGNGRNDVYARLRYSRNVVSDEEACGFSESVKCILESMPLSTTVGDAVERLMQIQSKSYA